MLFLLTYKIYLKIPIFFCPQTRYVKMINSHKKKFTTVLQQMIDAKAYERTGDGKYMTVKENNETWNVVWLITQNKKSKVQDYWTIMTPENELDYLKHIIKSFKNQSEIKSRLL